MPIENAIVRLAQTVEDGKTVLLIDNPKDNTSSRLTATGVVCIGHQ